MEDKLGTDTICRTFNQMNWHDSQLIGFSLCPNKAGTTHEMHFWINFITMRNEPKSVYWMKKKMILFDCTIAKIDLDLEGKMVCSNSIASAFCTKESDLKTRIEKEQLVNESFPLANYYHFNILLIAPGGEINVFAKGFELEDVADP